MKNKRTLKMVQMAILIAVLLVMSYTPLGYLKIGLLSISLLSIPVVIGAMLVGPAAGAVLGAVFGLTSFAQCFGADAFGAALLSINPFLTFLVCVPTRTLMGFLAGVIFRGVHRIDKTKTVSYFVGGLSGAVLNTVFFMGLLMVCFWNTDYIQGLNQTMGGLGLWAFLIAFGGINGVVEAIVACAAGGIISKAVSKALRINE